VEQLYCGTSAFAGAKYNEAIIHLPIQIKNQLLQTTRNYLKNHANTQNHFAIAAGVC
jgi:hypothetical protein